MNDTNDLLPVIDPDKWERRFTIEARRVSGAVRLYRSIGYEVRVESVGGAQELTCMECFKDSDEIVLISTRPLRSSDR